MILKWRKSFYTALITEKNIQDISAFHLEYFMRKVLIPLCQLVIEQYISKNFKGQGVIYESIYTQHIVYYKVQGVQDQNKNQDKTKNADDKQKKQNSEEFQCFCQKYQLSELNLNNMNGNQQRKQFIVENKPTYIYYLIKVACSPAKAYTEVFNIKQRYNQMTIQEQYMIESTIHDLNYAILNFFDHSIYENQRLKIGDFYQFDNAYRDSFSELIRQIQAIEDSLINLFKMNPLHQRTQQLSSNFLGHFDFKKRTLTSLILQATYQNELENPHQIRNESEKIDFKINLFHQKSATAFFLSLQNKTILRSSDSFSQLFGVNSSDMIGKPISLLFHDYYFPHINSYIEKLVEESNIELIKIGLYYKFIRTAKESLHPVVIRVKLDFLNEQTFGLSCYIQRIENDKFYINCDQNFMFLDVSSQFKTILLKNFQQNKKAQKYCRPSEFDSVQITFSPLVQKSFCELQKCFNIIQITKIKKLKKIHEINEHLDQVRETFQKYFSHPVEIQEYENTSKNNSFTKEIYNYTTQETYFKIDNQPSKAKDKEDSQNNGKPEVNTLQEIDYFESNYLHEFNKKDKSTENQCGNVNMEKIIEDILKYNFITQVSKNQKKDDEAIKELKDSHSRIHKAIKSNISRHLLQLDKRSQKVYDTIKECAIKYFSKQKNVKNQEIFSSLNIKVEELCDLFLLLKILPPSVHNQVSDFNSLVQSLQKYKTGINMYLIRDCLYGDPYGLISKFPSLFYLAQGESIHMYQYQKKQIQAFKKQIAPSFYNKYCSLFNLDYKAYGVSKNIRHPTWINLDQKHGVILIEGTPSVEDMEEVLIRMYDYTGYVAKSFILKVTYNQTKKSGKEQSIPEENEQLTDTHYYFQNFSQQLKINNIQNQRKPFFFSDNQIRNATFNNFSKNNEIKYFQKWFSKQFNQTKDESQDQNNKQIKKSYQSIQSYKFQPQLNSKNSLISIKESSDQNILVSTISRDYQKQQKKQQKNQVEELNSQESMNQLKKYKMNFLTRTNRKDIQKLNTQSDFILEN
ncbi:hypothetical protein ABPG72_008495 [Tetrahymena utriculariae]